GREGERLVLRERAPVGQRGGEGRVVEPAPGEVERTVVALLVVSRERHPQLVDERVGRPEEARRAELVATQRGNAREPDQRQREQRAPTSLDRELDAARERLLGPCRIASQHRVAQRYQAPAEQRPVTVALGLPDQLLGQPAGPVEVAGS